MMVKIDVEDAVKLRDHSQAIADVWNEILEKNEPKQEEPKYDLMKIVTEQVEGPSGIYLKVTAKNNPGNPDYEALIEDLKQHNGKLTKQGYFVWLFDDKETAGMKLSKK